MIAGYFHEGSGLGNQLHRYVMTRVVATDKGFDWGMENPWYFKGNSFMEIDVGSPPCGFLYSYTEPRKMKTELVYDYDFDGIRRIRDNTRIDGEFQGEKYFSHRIKDIREWLKVKYLHLDDNVCVINFRGGEYKVFPELFLTHDYWQIGIEMMRKINPQMKFEVHTDDPEEAKRFFPDFPCIQNIGLNWRSIRYAKYLLLSNSSFAILPALLNQNVKKIIAPKFWARRNKGFWMMPYNNYKGWTYI